MGTVIFFGDDDPLLRCGVDCTSDAETRGYLKVGGWPRVLCGALLFIYTPPHTVELGTGVGIVFRNSLTPLVGPVRPALG